MREPVTHTLKTLPIYFDAVARGDKTFDVRKNDRAYQTGDIVVLKRWLLRDPDVCRYSDRFDDHTEPLTFRIGWILQGGQLGIKPGTCVFSLSPMKGASRAAFPAADTEMGEGGGGDHVDR